MRAIILAVVVAAGIGFIGTSAASAAPASGVTIGETATANTAVIKAHWRGPSRWRHRGCHHRYRSWGRCW
jgi:hypothetical protein